MASIDMAIEELANYRPEPTAPADLGRFWEETLAESSANPVEVELAPSGIELRGVHCLRLAFSGFRGELISGWYVRPEGDGPFPGLVWYHGYSGRGARPLELYAAAAQGLAVVSMDCRGQGGDSPETPAHGAGHAPGWLTQGIRDPAGYYYRYVYTDAVRAIEALASQAEVDAGRIAVTGASQGGGLALAAAALSHVPVFVWADMPFLCHFRRGVEVALNGPYPEISDFVRRLPGLEAEVFRTLSYFDNFNLASWITCPAVVTAGLWDEICPPSTIFPTFERIAAPDKSLETFSFQRHELVYEIEEGRLRALVERLRP